MEKRQAGVLLALSSLPNAFGIGDLGASAFDFIDSLAEMGVSLWQTLPVNEADEGGCPYASTSAFGGDPLLLSPEWLLRRGLVTANDLIPLRELGLERVQWQKLRQIKMSILRIAYEKFDASKMATFVDEESDWLTPRSEFAARRAKWGTCWSEWPERDSSSLSSEIGFQNFLQYCFFAQWAELKEHAIARGIQIVGDIPMFVNSFSSDVWSCPSDFKLDRHKKPLVVAGAPPDQFTERGQNWGAPVFDWSHMRSSGWNWWRKRITHQMRLFDCLRIDHFRGLAAVWEIPAQGIHSNDARFGKWVAGGGAEVLRAIVESSPRPDSLIAEDLGVITKDVDDLRDQFHLPTMRVLQFGLERGETTQHWPSHYPKHCVAYTGTHDNTTLSDWIRSSPSRPELNHPIDFILNSEADWVIIPAQDWLGLGKDARMNTPGTVGSDNWSWRLLERQWSSLDRSALRTMIQSSGRLEL